MAKGLRQQLVDAGLWDAADARDPSRDDCAALALVKIWKRRLRVTYWGDWCGFHLEYGQDYQTKKWAWGVQIRTSDSTQITGRTIGLAVCRAVLELNRRRWLTREPVIRKLKRA